MRHLRQVDNVESNVYEGGFSLTFTDKDKGQVRLHLDRWWLVYLAQELGRVLQFEREEVARIERLVREAI